MLEADHECAVRRAHRTSLAEPSQSVRTHPETAGHVGCLPCEAWQRFPVLAGVLSPPLWLLCVFGGLLSVVLFHESSASERIWRWLKDSSRSPFCSPRKPRDNGLPRASTQGPALPSVQSTNRCDLRREQPFRRAGLVAPISKQQRGERHGPVGPSADALRNFDAGGIF